ncbi:MAG: [FeFe] hydrogenase H-cluster radical SAM maturase HydE [Bacteroidales bacterium]|nr:[FeFe] hydrogenase H-cluster radical SAM maturase HydE [Bacteroidales bacterium]
MKTLEQILAKAALTRDDIIYLLGLKGEDRKVLLKKSAAIKQELIGNKVYFRGLIEYSNKCKKDCYYCGVRASNKGPERYQVSDPEVLEAARFAYENKFASLVIQSGERSDEAFIAKIEFLLQEIKKLSNHQLGITLSCGEQTKETYERWKKAGAHRYLLRIETSNQELYSKLHPKDQLHSFHERIAALKRLREAGFQVGTGVMIGLPFQTVEHLADDLLFFKKLDIDMAGMGPYIEHVDTPLFDYKESLMPLKDRFDLSLSMVALLRIIMKDINIAATTAMQAIDPQGREKALLIGANIIMPNLTPVKYREDYLLYEDKPCIDEEADECQKCLEARIHIAGGEIGYNEWGDSLHFQLRNKH